MSAGREIAAGAGIVLLAAAVWVLSLNVLRRARHAAMAAGCCGCCGDSAGR